jgi:hypothetical protein
MHLPSNPLQPLIGCPEAASRHEACGKQVSIDQTDSESIQMMALNEEKDFVVVSFLNIWKRMKEGYDLFSVFQVATSHFTDHERVDTHFIPLQQRN